MIEATLAIIAGGKGARLGGVPKGLIRVGGRTILERLLELGAGFSDVMLVGQYEVPTGVRVVADVVPARGAPGGVHSALVHARYDRVLCVGVDMPFVDQASIDELLAADAEVVCFAGEPLLAVYRRSIEPRWRALLAAEPSFRELFSHFEVTRLPLSNPRVTANVNTPEDLARYGAELPPASERA